MILIILYSLLLLFDFFLFIKFLPEICLGLLGVCFLLPGPVGGQNSFSLPLRYSFSSCLYSIHSVLLLRMSLWTSLGRNVRLQELLGGAPRIIMGDTEGFDDDTEGQGAVVLVLSEAPEVTEALETSAHDESADDPVLVAVASAVAATALAGAALYCFVCRLALNLFSYHSLVYNFLVLFQYRVDIHFHMERLFI